MRARQPGALIPETPRIMVLRCPGLCDLAAPGPHAAELFEQVIAAVTGFCPKVEAVEPGVCAFGTGGPARYFGGEMALAGQVIAAMAELGVESRVGVADGLFAALLAARGIDPPQASPPQASPAHAGAPQAGPPRARRSPVLVIPPGQTAEFLARQPVSVLEDQDLAGLLTRLGLRSLGDLAALPVGDVAGRFGPAGETAHRLASGRGSRPLAAAAPAEDLSAVREFDPPEPLAEPVAFAAKALAGQMHDGLSARGLTCVRVEVRATWADGRESRRLWRHDGLLSAAALAGRVRWQLDGWQLDGWQLDGWRGAAGETGTSDGGITVLRLVPDQVVRATGHQLALWGEPVVSDRVARAAMRVQAMLGHQAVLRPVPGGGRDFCEQVTLVPFGGKTEPRLAAGPPWPGRVMGPAPGLAYPFAREADVTDEAGAAVTVTGRCVMSAAPAWLALEGDPPRRITGWAGPWPLSERWWDPVAARRRARFQLLTGDGRAWQAAVQDGRWLIEAGYW